MQHLPAITYLINSYSICYGFQLHQIVILLYSKNITAIILLIRWFSSLMHNLDLFLFSNSYNFLRYSWYQLRFLRNISTSYIRYKSLHFFVSAAQKLAYIESLVWCIILLFGYLICSLYETQCITHILQIMFLCGFCRSYWRQILLRLQWQFLVSYML